MKCQCAEPMGFTRCLSCWGDIEPAEQEKLCIHRGLSIGQASCGCGTVYECAKLGGICSPFPPVDEWATVEIQGVKKEIRDLNYQCCRDCAEFTTTT